MNSIAQFLRHKIRPTSVLCGTDEYLKSYCLNSIFVRSKSSHSRFFHTVDDVLLFWQLPMGSTRMMVVLDLPDVPDFRKLLDCVKKPRQDVYLVLLVPSEIKIGKESYSNLVSVVNCFPLTFLAVTT